MKEETKQWLRKSEEDLKTARYNFDGSKLDTAAFFCQQAAEKALKAFQIEKLNRFDKIHDLVKLARSIKANAKIIKMAEELNPHYIATRYPIAEVYDKEDVKTYIKLAEEIIKWAVKKIG